MGTPTLPNPDVWTSLSRILAAAVQHRASDIHLRAGAPPFLRVDGVLGRTAAPPAPPVFVEDAIAMTWGMPPAHRGLGSFEYAFDLPEVARFRCHAFREAQGWALSLRVVPQQIPSFQELRLPPIVKQLAEPQSGLVLVTGPTGSGKSTTCAAMLRYAAAAETLHVVTLEDPVEFRLTDTQSCITQREVGRDAATYKEGLEAALREDPDLIFIGEVRTAAAVEVALQAAEAGHAVLATFHTGSGVKTVQRLLSLFPPEEQLNARLRLADALRGVLTQRLLPRRGGRGRVLCCEVLVNNYAVKECIRDPARTAAIHAVLERSADQQMVSFDQALTALVREQIIAPEIAVRHATSAADMRRAIGFAQAG